MTAASFLTQLPQAINRRVDGWLTAPEVNAAGRIGLFRIVYGLFLLWIGSQGYYSIIGQTPSVFWQPILFLRGLSSPTQVPLVGYQLLETTFIFAIVLLIIGYRVRAATVAVFALGLTIETFRLSYSHVEHGSLFQVFYIPLVMCFSQWGAAYSIDAVLRARSGETVAASDPSWRYIWPMRVLLAVLGVLFLSAFYWKMNGSAWQYNSRAFMNFLLNENVEVTSKGGYASPLLPMLARIRVVTVFFRYATLCFEGLFITSLLHRRLRNLFVSIAIVFHAVNALFMYVSFSYLLIVYPLFVDLQRAYARWWPRALRPRLDDIPARRLIVGALAVAAASALLWRVWAFRGLFSLWGLLDWRTIWIPLLPVGTIGVVRALWSIASGVWMGLRRGRRSAEPAMPG